MNSQYQKPLLSGQVLWHPCRMFAPEYAVSLMIPNALRTGKPHESQLSATWAYGYRS